MSQKKKERSSKLYATNMNFKECIACGSTTTSLNKLYGRDFEVGALFAKYSNLADNDRYIASYSSYICKNCSARLRTLDKKHGEFADMCLATSQKRFTTRHFFTGSSNPYSLPNFKRKEENVTGSPPEINISNLVNQTLKQNTQMESGLSYDQTSQLWKLTPFVPSILTSLYHLYEDQALSDAKLKCACKNGDTFYIQAHSCVLAASSPILKDVLTKGPKGSTIEIRGYSKQTVMKFVDFMYGQVIHIAANEVEELQNLTSQLKSEQLTSLLTQCNSGVVSDHTYVSVADEGNKLHTLAKALPLVLPPKVQLCGKTMTINTINLHNPVLPNKNDETIVPSNSSSNDIRPQKTIESTRTHQLNTRRAFRKIMPKPTGDPDVDFYIKTAGERTLNEQLVPDVSFKTGNKDGVDKQVVNNPTELDEVTFPCYFAKPSLEVNPEDSDESNEKPNTNLKGNDEFAKYKYVCMKCLAVLENLYAFKNHSSDCKVEKSTKICRKCETESASEHGYRTHLKRHHGITRSVKCPSCLERIVEAYDYIRHRGRICLNRPLPLVKCDHCNRVFRNKHLLQSHMQRVAAKPDSLTLKGFSKGRQVKNKEFYKKRYLGYKNRKYTCPVCKMIITGYNRYSFHKASHDGHSHICHSCGKTFRWPSNLNLHVKNMHGSTDCSKCSFKAETRRELNCHLMEEHNENPVLCSKCGAQFPSQTNLKRHEAVHRSDSYGCELCDFKTVDIIRYQLHMKRKHSKVERKRLNCTVCSKTSASTSPNVQHHSCTHQKDLPVMKYTVESTEVKVPENDLTSVVRVSSPGHEEHVGEDAKAECETIKVEAFSFEWTTNLSELR